MYVHHYYGTDMTSCMSSTQKNMDLLWHKKRKPVDPHSLFTSSKQLILVHMYMYIQKHDSWDTNLYDNAHRSRYTLQEMTHMDFSVFWREIGYLATSTCCIYKGVNAIIL